MPGFSVDLFLSVLESIGICLFVVFFLGLCVFVHELGHFLVARWRGLHVVAFSIGFKTIWSKKVGGVDYRIGCIPVGGYVDLPQVDITGEPKLEDGTVLPRAKPIDRVLTAVAGPFCNILFGLLLGLVIWWHGVPQDTPKMRSIVVAEIDHQGPEYKAGLRKGDRIVRLNGEKFYCTWNGFVQKILLAVGDVTLDVDRGNQNLQITYEPKENTKISGSLKREKVAYPFFTPQIPIVLYPLSGSPAAKAGIKSGDILMQINTYHVSNYEELQAVVQWSEGKALNFKVKRGDKIIDIPNIVPEENKNIPLEQRIRYYIGVIFDTAQSPLEVKTVVPDCPAGKAGIKVGDRILKLNGEECLNFNDFQKKIMEKGNNEITLEIKRGKQLLQFKLRPRIRKKVYYTIGVKYALLDHPTPFVQFNKIFELSYKSLRGVSYWIGKKLGMTEHGSTLKPNNFSGPIGLATTVYLSIKKGSIWLGLYFVVIISFALAIFNLLPLPVLDGGHVAFALVEMVIRRPLPESAVKFLAFVFVSLLVSLMIYVSAMDFLRIWFMYMDSKEAQTQQSSVDDQQTADDQKKD